jgi:hypothetical protein
MPIVLESSDECECSTPKANMDEQYKEFRKTIDKQLRYDQSVSPSPFPKVTEMDTEIYREQFDIFQQRVQSPDNSELQDSLPDLD